jgi:hypothetical protein
MSRPMRLRDRNKTIPAGVIPPRKTGCSLLMRESGVALALACLTIAIAVAAKSSGTGLSAKHTDRSRRAQLVEANVIAVQAYQMIRTRQGGDAPSACYPDMPDTATLQNLVKHQGSLLAEPAAQVAGWADSKQSTFNPAKDLEPLLHAGIRLSPELPVNVFTQYLQAKAPEQPRDNIRSVANLYQTVLEVDRDGTVLQDLYRFYIALKLPVYVGQLGLPGTDADFLAAARELYGKSCASPVDLSVPAWQIAGRKIWNWGEKNLHVRDVNTIATEMLADPQIVPLIPAMKAMKAERIAVIGDSYTMDEHWSTPSSFPPIVAAMFGRENPQIRFRQWSHGGLGFARAYRNYYADVVAWKPNLVLLVVENRTPEDMAAMKKMIEELRATGVRVMRFDDVEWPDADQDPARVRQVMLMAKQDGAEIIPCRAILNSSPDHSSFPAMDGIHKTEPYHRIMAILWLKAILGS